MPLNHTSSRYESQTLFATGQPATLEMIRAFRMMGVHDDTLRSLDEKSIVKAFEKLDPPSDSSMKKMHRIAREETIRAAEILLYLCNLTLQKNKQLHQRVKDQLKRFGKLEDLHQTTCTLQSVRNKKKQS